MSLSSNSLILCATSRLAQHRQRQAPEVEARVWVTPLAMTPMQWLALMAEEALFEGLLPETLMLSGESEQIVWESVLASLLAGEFAELFDRQGLAMALREADALAVTWQLEFDASPVSSETGLFLRARAAFLKRCRAQGWIDQARLHQAVLDCLEAGALRLPDSVQFVGFDRLSPLELRLQTIFAARGVSVQQLAPTAPPADPAFFICDDLSAECRAVAAWVAAERSRQPDVRLGIVAPDLAAVRTPLSAALDEALHPYWVRPVGAEAARCYNFSLGESLAGLPLVRCALDWLNVAVRPVQVEQALLSQLLRAPYWAVQEEADARALADAAVRRRLGFFTSLEALRQLLQREGWDAENERNRCHVSIACLWRLGQALADAGGKQLPSQWSQRFGDWLGLLRWPGNRTLSSHEYQAQQAFVETLAALAGLDDVLGAVRAGEALRRLQRLCQERVFQAKTTGPAPVQVLGVLESAGLEFDALWVMGLNDQVWPPPPRPNPFIPVAMQRAKNTPHASAEVEQAFAEQVQARLLRAAPRVSLSCSRLAGERLLRPSPLLAGRAGQVPEVPTQSPAARELVRLADWQAPPVEEGEKVSGGSGLLKAQAICPAWGFYAYRLGAKALETPVEGLDPRERGSLVHATLEHFWLQVRDSASLAGLDANDLTAAIAAAVEAGLTQFEQERNIALSPRFRALEARRLGKLLGDWLTVEAARPQAFSVVATEREALLNLQGIQVRVVVDRIDQLEDGSCLVIDYKTGRNVDTKNWSGPRLTEPQLPLYASKVVALAAELGQARGVAFARVHPEEVRFYGVTADAGVLPDVAGLADKKQRVFAAEDFPDWPAVLNHWSLAIDNIADEIRCGVASVSFADEADLVYCEVKPLLRLPERALQAAAGRENSA